MQHEFALGMLARGWTTVSLEPDVGKLPPNSFLFSLQKVLGTKLNYSRVQTQEGIRGWSTGMWEWSCQRNYDGDQI
jgi:hypothetical protein